MATQIIHGITVRTLKSKSTGERFIQIREEGTIIPMGIARHAAGKDGWMRDIVVKCGDCLKDVRLGDTECDVLCPDCLHKAEEEITAENA